MPESSNSMHSSIFIIFPEVDQTHKNLNFITIQFESQGPIIGTKNKVITKVKNIAYLCSFYVEIKMIEVENILFIFLVISHPQKQI